MLCSLVVSSDAIAGRRGQDKSAKAETADKQDVKDGELADQQVNASNAKGGMRYRIMVSAFDDRSQYMSAAGLTISNAWQEMLTNALQNDGRFLVVAGKAVRTEARSEEEFAESDWSAGGTTAPRKGNMATAQLLVRGTIMSVVDKTSSQSGITNALGLPIGGNREGAEVRMIVKLYDPQSALVIASREIAGKSSSWNIGLPSLPGGSSLFFGKNKNLAKAASDALKKAVDFCAEQLDKIEWTGAITSLKDDGSVVINRGEREGVALGQTFAVGTCESMDDPETGEFLGFDKTQVALLRVKKIQEKYSICELVEQSKTQLEKGMSIWIAENN